MKKQRRSLRCFGKVLDPANEDGVIATDQAGFVGNLEAGAASGKYRSTAGAGLPVETGKAIDRPGRETIRKILLICRQDVDDVMAGAAEGCQVVRAVIQTPENQRRIKRNRREGIDGQANGMTVRVDGRDDGDTGGEAAKRVSQGAGIGFCLRHRDDPAVKGRIIRAPAAHVETDLTAQHSFTAHLIAWQKVGGRHDLPWQNTRDPYRIWLSEIMLQQTQVATVIPYYQRFLASFPDVASLAAAPIEAVIEHWAGLGYYARARNLHRCAQQIVIRYAGNFPESPEQLRELPGIGRSTAAAIAAFAFGCRAAILDGNVKRVLCRYFGVEGFPGTTAVERSLWAQAESLLPDSEIEAYTQGLMDLGASLCTRGRPRCGYCPLAAACVACRDGRQAELPQARPRKEIPERHSSFVMISDGRRLLLERRPPSGLWGGLLVPPEGEVSEVIARLGLQALEQTELAPLRHAFTHFRLTLMPVLCLVAASPRVAESGREWIDIDKAADAGVPTPIRKLIRLVANAGD